MHLFAYVHVHTVYIEEKGNTIALFHRNCFGDMYMLKTEDGNVCWEYIKALVKVQDMGQLHLANKLTKRHIQYKEQIMKVKLAAQVFSQSTAEALTTLSHCEVYPEFTGVEPTVKFLKVSKITQYLCIPDCIREERIIGHEHLHGLRMFVGYADCFDDGIYRKREPNLQT